MGKFFITIERKGTNICSNCGKECGLFVHDYKPEGVLCGKCNRKWFKHLLSCPCAPHEIHEEFTRWTNYNKAYEAWVKEKRY